MFNFYELLEITKDAGIDAEKKLFDLFSNDFAAEFSKIKVNNSSRKRALESFSKKVTVQDSGRKVYVTGPQVLSLREELNASGKESEDLTQNILDIIKDSRLVEDPHILECYALAKCLGMGTDSERYFFEINGTYYDVSLVYGAFSCIAENNFSYVDCKQGKNNVLTIQTRNGFAIVCPIAFSAVNPLHDCTFEKYMDRAKAHEKRLTEKFVNIA